MSLNILYKNRYHNYFDYWFECVETDNCMIRWFINKNQELKINNVSNLENKKDLNNLEKDVSKEDDSTKS